MKELKLIIKQKYFDEILAGTKTEEYREIKPTTFKKYCRYLIEDKEYEQLHDFPGYTDETEFLEVPIKYDAIRFYVGYAKDRDSALVEVKGAEIEVFVDENDEEIVYEYNGVYYVAAQMIYYLGKVLEKDLKSERKQRPE